MKSKKIMQGLILVGLASTTGIVSAQQVTLDFNNASPAGYDGKANTDGGCGASGQLCYQSNNFVLGAVFDTNNPGTHFHTPATALLPDGSDDIALETVNDANGIYIRTADLSSFSLNSFHLDSNLTVNNRNNQTNVQATGANAFWEIIGFNTAYNPTLDSFTWGSSSLTAGGANTAPTNLNSFGTVVPGAYQAVDNGFIGDVILNASFQDVKAVWIRYGNHSTVPTDGSKFTGYIDNMVVGPVAAVPVPAAVYLFGTGLMGFLALGKKRQLI